MNEERAYGVTSRRFTAGLFVSAVLAVPTASSAHEAPAGWQYDYSCCSDKDCAPTRSPVSATARGWLITSTGETIPYGDHRLHDSKDGDFHRCAVGATNETRCLYVPPMGL